jgi:hypothetical protein
VAAAPVPTSAPAPTTPLLGLDALYSDLDDAESGARPAPGDEDVRSRTRTVLALVIGFVVVFLALAYCGLRGLGDGAFVPAPHSATPSASATPTSPPTTSPTTASETSSSSGAIIPVASARGFDPEGDGSEKDDLAARAIDGSTSKGWTSDTYKSVEFGGLKKGVGLLLDLGSSQQVTSVSVRVGAGGGTFQLRTLDGDRLDSKVLAEAEDAAGTFTLKPDEPLTTQRLVLWCTKPAEVDGGYRVEVEEVVVR